MKSLAGCRLYNILDTSQLGGRSPSEVARALCQGGADLIQLRAKGKAPEAVRAIAAEIQPILQRAGVGLVINDHWEVAQSLRAELCHLGQEDFFGAGFTNFSQLLQRHPGATLAPPLLGLSTHSPEQAQRALAAGPAYLAIGPVFATPTKPTAPPVTLDYVRWAAAHVTIPWFAIGGINLGNVDEVLRAGATRICVVSAILKSPDIALACREFKQRLLS